MRAIFSLLIFVLWSWNASGKDYMEYIISREYFVKYYYLNLFLNQSLFDGTSSGYEGNVTIVFRPLEKHKYMELHVNPKYLTVQTVRFNNMLLDPSLYFVNETTEILVINKTVKTKEAMISFEFNGTLANDNYGFYRSSYMENSKIKYLLTTHMQPTGARRVFPCFDEPFFKSRFSISITHPTHLNVLGNAPPKKLIYNETTNSTTTDLRETVFMPTYLVAFVISDFDCKQAKPLPGLRNPLRVCSRKNVDPGSRDYALEVAPKILLEYNDFLEIEYYKYMDKMDLVAIPDFSNGAMENWGLITYREVYILWNQNESSTINKQYIAEVIAHELAHSWFGNLVTIEWWDALFMNEGFARFYQYLILDRVFPEWEMSKQFIVHQHQAALHIDSTELTDPLWKPVTDNIEILERFNFMTYAKGAAIVRMLRIFVGEEAFDDGVTEYLNRRELNFTTSDIFFNFIQPRLRSGTCIPAKLLNMMDEWIYYDGFPLLNVTSLPNEEIEITQEKYSNVDDDEDLKWYVPVYFNLSTGYSNFLWLTPHKSERLLIGSAKWILLNSGVQGYYRVNYDHILWKKLGAALYANHSEFSEITRSQIVSDLFNLAETGRVPYDKAFEYMAFMQYDTSYYSWFTFISEYRNLLDKTGEESDLGKEMKDHIKDWMDYVYESAKEYKPEDVLYTQKHVLVTKMACYVGMEPCVEMVKKELENYRRTGVRPNPDLRRIIYCEALRHSKNQSDWEFLYDVYKKSNIPSEQEMLLSTLGCTPDENLIKRYLNYTLDPNSGIRGQDGEVVFYSAHSNGNGVNTALEFLTKNYEEIEKKYQSLNILDKLISELSKFLTTEEQLESLKNLITVLDAAHREPESVDFSHEHFRKSVENALSMANANIEWIAKYSKTLEKYYEHRTFWGHYHWIIIWSGVGFIFVAFLGIALVWTALRTNQTVCWPR